MSKSFQFSDPEQESKFQEIYEKVNEVDDSVENPRWLLNEEDLREVFQAGLEFQIDRLIEREKDFRK